MKQSDLITPPRGGVRFALEQLLDKYSIQNPGRPIVQAALAIELGVSRERIRQLYYEIAAEKEVPPLVSRKFEGDRRQLDRQVKELMAQGIQDLGEVAQRLCVTKKLVLQAKSRNRRKELKTRNDLIKNLRNQDFGDKAILEMTGLSRGVVNGALSALRRTDDATRLRKKYRTEAEIEHFKEQLVQLRLDPRNLTTKQIAKLTGENEYTISGYIRKLVQDRKVPNRKLNR